LRNKIRSAQDSEYNSLLQSTNSNGFDIKPHRVVFPNFLNNNYYFCVEKL
jgi:hypothetical protein